MGSVRDRLSLRGVLTALATVLLLGPVIVPLLVPVIDGPARPFPLAVGMLIAVGVGAILYWRLTGDGDGDEGSIWNAIPRRQYDGRHAESGGLARDEQEAAIEEIQQQAAERERER
ncbi:MAG: hypothetical protein J07HN6_02850 [Halonotius sp. J07HN6]|nr:MAG: hypothetical protein J07HN6_02850 [Halonotius sp. J07HN6]